MSDTLHLLRANLYLRQLIIQAEHRRMQRLVAIHLRRSDKVFDASILGTPQGMDMPQSQVAILHGVDQYTVGDQVMNLAEFFSTLLQLAIDAGEMFLPGMYLSMFEDHHARVLSHCQQHLAYRLRTLAAFQLAGYALLLFKLFRRFQGRGPLYRAHLLLYRYRPARQGVKFGDTINNIRYRVTKLLTQFI